jgi:predicted TIM-barrel fold metal-dependent hydrolase
MAIDPVLPIKIDTTSNGEFAPLALPEHLIRAKHDAARSITDNARRVGKERRRFLASLCGAATTLLALNRAFAAAGATGGGYALPQEAALDDGQAAQLLAGKEFILDVQTHMLDPNGPWRQRRPQAARALAPGPRGACGRADPVDCYAGDQFVKDMFLDSDTDMAVLSFMPGLPEDNFLSIEEAARTRALVDSLGRGHRLLLHAMVIPNHPPLERQFAMMERAVAEFRVAAWKVYTQWGPTGRGWWLDDPMVGLPFIEKARALGVRTICVHKGLTFGGHAPEFARCDDVGRVARRYPDVKFLIYHSGYETSVSEGPFDPGGRGLGCDSLVKSLIDNGVPPNANVYSELGSTWRILMRDPTQAAHALGKLIRHVGEANVLWGTDSPWFGSPQDQILAFRAFQIAPQLIERHGYAPLTPALKARILGLNAAPVYGVEPSLARRQGESDVIGRMREAYRDDPRPDYGTYGPMTAAEFQALVAARGGLPG